MGGRPGEYRPPAINDPDADPNHPDAELLGFGPVTNAFSMAPYKNAPVMARYKREPKAGTR